MLLPRPRELYPLSFILLFFILVASTLFQNQVSEAQEDSISKLFEKAASLYDQGEYQEAIIWYDRVLTIDPNHVKALNNKGSALNKLDQYQEAITWYDKALAIDPNEPKALKNKGIALKNLGQ